MTQLRTLIVDDEKFSLLSLRKLLSTYPQIAIVGEASDGVQAVEKIEAAHPDLVFLDIQMPGLSGFEVLRSLTLAPKPEVVFVTAFDQYAVRAFEVNAIDYLLKPIDEHRLRLTIEKITLPRASLPDDFSRIRKLLSTLDQTWARIPLRRGKKIFLMSPSEIHYLRSEHGVTIVMTAGGEFWTQYTLAEMEEILDDQIFFRSHRSIILNLDRIKEIVPAQSGVYDIYLDDSQGTCLPLSRDRAKVLRDKYKF